jgi:triosephosphate isomerase (TIM)
METQQIAHLSRRSRPLTGPIFEIGPKNLLRRPDIETLALAAGAAGTEFGVSVVLTVPTPLIAPIRDLDSGVLVFAQGMDPEPMGNSVGRVIAEALADAGAAGVMLNHDSNPLEPQQLSTAVERAHHNGLHTILCAGTDAEAVRFARLHPTVILYEPPELIGKSGAVAREWIAPANTAVHRITPGMLMMHAGGVGSPRVAEAIMALGADGTGSTSGVLSAEDPPAAARAFIAATRRGWDNAHRIRTSPAGSAPRSHAGSRPEGEVQ